jgi:hypothetical protein
MYRWRCTGRGEDTLYGIIRLGAYMVDIHVRTLYRWICMKCMYSKEGDEQRAGVCVHYLRYYVAVGF